MPRFIFSLFLLLSFLTISACAVQQQELSSDVSTALSTHYPQIKYQQINPTPVAGIYEVVVENGEIIYFAPASGHMFFGELWTANARNLTQDSKNKRMTSMLKVFPLDLAVKIGDGPNQVIEVIDPGCPFCRHGSDFFVAEMMSPAMFSFFPSIGSIHRPRQKLAAFWLRKIRNLPTKKCSAVSTIPSLFLTGMTMAYSINIERLPTKLALPGRHNFGSMGSIFLVLTHSSSKNC